MKNPTRAHRAAIESMAREIAPAQGLELPSRMRNCGQSTVKLSTR